MNVLLLRPPDPLQDVQLLSHTRPMNLAYLAAYLRKNGIAVTIVDFEVEKFDPENFTALLKRLRPALVGVSCVTPTITSGARLCAFVKETSPETVTVVGGAHANGLPRETMEEFPPFDYLVYGEGEVTLLELCRSVAAGDGVDSIDGLVHRRGGTVVKNPPRQLIENLDDLPLPAREMLAVGPQAGHASRGFANSVASAELFTSRGCPVACSFCAIQATFGNRVRFHGMERIQAEVADIRSRGCTHLVIADDTFTLQRERAMEICRILARSGMESWNCDTRVTTVTPELLSAMARSGCRKVAFGVESGSQRIMDLTGKQISVEQVRAAVSWAREAGIRHVEGNFIIGADPSETMADLAETRAMILNLPWTFVSVSIIVPYPGTPVYRKMKAAGQIEADAAWDDFVMFGRPPRWHTDHLGAEELVAMQRKLTRSFYLRPRYVAARLGEIRSTAEARYWIHAGQAYLRWYLFGKM